MTLLALPKPGPPPSFFLAAWACCRPRRSARLRPRAAEPPTPGGRRGVMPSQVSLPEGPGITSRVGSSQVLSSGVGRQAGRLVGELLAPSGYESPRTDCLPRLYPPGAPGVNHLL